MRRWRRPPRQPRFTFRCWAVSPSRSMGSRCQIRWRLRKAKTLVKLLALAPGIGCTAIVRWIALWSDTEPEAAAKQPASDRARRAAHDGRRNRSHSATMWCRLCPAGGLIVDVDQFEQAAGTARSSGEITALQQALDLWTGPLLPEDQYADWAAEQRERLSETHAGVARPCSDRSCLSGR